MDVLQAVLDLKGALDYTCSGRKNGQKVAMIRSQYSLTVFMAGDLGVCWMDSPLD